MSQNGYDCVKNGPNDQHNRSPRMSISHTNGLLYTPGQNNCLLNRAVQSERQEILKFCVNKSAESEDHKFNGNLMNNLASQSSIRKPSSDKQFSTNSTFKVENSRAHMPKPLQANSPLKQFSSSTSTFRPNTSPNRIVCSEQKVKDLAFKFEKIIVFQDKQQMNSLVQNKTSETHEQNSNVQLKPNVIMQMPNRLPLMSQNDADMNFKNDNHTNPRMVSYLPNTVYQAPSNCMSATTMNTKRPDKPPDYQTAIKRLGMRNGLPTLNLQQTRNFYMTAKNDVNHFKTHSVPNSPLSPTPSPSQEEPKSWSPSSSSNKSFVSDEVYQAPTVIKKRNGIKKSVSFSDQVVLVACADEEPEEFLPNPILDRILGRTAPNNPVP